MDKVTKARGASCCRKSRGNSVLRNMTHVGILREKVEEEVRLEQEVLRALDVFIKEMEELLPILSRGSLFSSEWFTVRPDQSEMRAKKARYNAMP